MSLLLTLSSDGSGFSPASISGLTLWLKAHAITGLNDGDPVATWTDLSGNGNNATQAVGANRPKYKTNIVNALPVVRFERDDSSNLGFADVFSSLTAAEIFVAVKINTDPPVAFADALWYFGSTASDSHYPFTDGNIYEDFGTSVRKTVGNPGQSLAIWAIYNITSISGEFTTRLSGTQIFTTATNTVGFTTTAAIGKSIGGAGFLDGDIAEIIMYNAKLSSGDRTLVKTYLASKYGITVA